MTAILSRKTFPSHLSSIRELDFSGDLFVDRLAGPWFRLAAQTLKNKRDPRSVEEVVSRRSILLAPTDFAEVYSKLESVGYIFDSLGKPGGVVSEGGGVREYDYAPFYRFAFPFTSVVAEPLVFLRSDTSGVRFFVNPDLWMFFELEEKNPGSGIWWDPRRGADVLVRHVMDDAHVEAVEIRTDYLLKYLRARQMSLLVGHYRHLHLFKPSKDTIGAFVEGDVAVGSPKRGAKAFLQNSKLREDFAGRAQFLQRRLHLWFEVKPPAINIDDPWADAPSFDPYAFTLPTSNGPVAPARWTHLQGCAKKAFEGVSCDFMGHVYFRQEVLTKYEGAAGFDVEDNGSVSSRHYWALNRSTSRIGNELLTTSIGDFAEGVPFEEWPHWKQYAVEPPSNDTVKALVQESPIPEAVNSLVSALNGLNAAFAEMAASLGVTIADPLWSGSLDSPAGRQLKWVYPATADDDEFLKRATLVSTLFLDGLQPATLRKLLNAVGKKLHETFDKSPKPLGSRKMLQRVTLMALLIEAIQPRLTKLPMLVMQAESKSKSLAQSDLQAELEGLRMRIQGEFAPLAFLYDLRTHGGLAHPPNKEQAAAAAAKLSLPKGNWHRMDYLGLLKLITKSLDRINEHLEAATQASM